MSLLDPASRSGARAGVLAALPMTVATFPFGLAYGVAVSATGMDPWVGLSASWTVLAGAAQLTMLSLMQAGAPWAVVVLAALVINLRFALYSMALAPGFRAFPRAWRLGLPYLMTDQTAALSLRFFAANTDPLARRWFYFGTGLTTAAVWWAGSVAGLLLGGALPAGFDVAFTVPLVFVVLLVPALGDWPACCAAVAGAGVAIAGATLPHGLNIVAGAAAGVLAGATADRWSAR